MLRPLLIPLSAVLMAHGFAGAEAIEPPKAPLFEARTAAQSERVELTPQPGSSFRGWDYLVQKLRADGVSEATLASIYSDPRMPFFGEVPFSVKPRESKHIYAPLTAPAKLDLAREFLAAHADTFAAAEKTFKVHRSVVASILLVETHFGKNTGRELVINRLSRVAAIGEPNNVILNYRRLLKDDPNLSFSAVASRAAYLERTFYPEVAALLQIIEQESVNPFELKGSRAGAFGLPQFLPTSFLRFGFDGDNDGSISLFEPSDAIWSTANFLAQSGWDDHAPLEKRREAIWKYNHSDAYIDTVLSLARSLRRPPTPRKAEVPPPPRVDESLPLKSNAPRNAE